jgi:hypothetical protein
MGETLDLRGKGTFCAGCGDYIGLKVDHEAYCDDCAHLPDVPEERTVRWLRLNLIVPEAT